MKQLFIALLLVLVAAPVAFAKEKAMTIRGEVTAVDATANTVTVKEKHNKEVTLNVTDKTRVMLGKEKKGLADIKAGDEIIAWTTEKEGKPTAKSIRISTKKVSQPAKAEKGKEKESESY
jgi:Cu/Ag efflux protein CusF